MTASSNSDIMMKSNSQFASAAATAIVPEYIPLRLDGWSHDWNVSTKHDKNTHERHCCIITDYYHKEATAAFLRTNIYSPLPDSIFLDRAYPRHHALILAAYGSSSKLVSHEFPKWIISGYEPYPQKNCDWFGFACERVHNSRHVTPFTEITSTYQKQHLTTLSGLTGLLVTRLMNHPQLICARTKKKYTEITNRCVHSAMAAEYLIGNRYYRGMTRYITSKHPVGLVDCDMKSHLTADDITPEALQLTQDELRETYNANIHRLLSMIYRFKRGFVHIEQIRNDPEFVRMMTAFWRSANQLLKMKDELENQAVPNNHPHDLQLRISFEAFEERKEAKRIAAISRISETGVVAPQLYQYDIVQIFDNKNQSYANYVRVSKHTHVRLANDGSTASFLAFAAIEPHMVNECYAPKLGGIASVFHGLSLKSCANYIPSRHPVYGGLRSKHQFHIMRTADAVNSSSWRVHPNPDAPIRGVERDTDERFRPTYVPFYTIVEHIIQRGTYAIDDLHNFPATHRNSGKLISACDANREFRERVYLHGERKNMYMTDSDGDDYCYSYSYGDSDYSDYSDDDNDRYVNENG